jgi:hypothetical protein
VAVFFCNTARNNPDVSKNILKFSAKNRTQNDGLMEHVEESLEGRL